MAGHSKWANIKHRKEKGDAQRGRLFTKLARQLAVATREGGPDPEANFRLRLVIEKCRAANMPNENIERVIKRAAGEQGGTSYEEAVYEGYGPGGVAILLEVTTDNRNRSAAELRHLFSRYGGSLGESGCVAWMFEKKGILVPAEAVDEETLLADAAEGGAEDVSFGEDEVEIVTAPGDFQQVRSALEAKGYRWARAEVTLRPKVTQAVAGPEAERALKLLEALEDHEDVQEVHTTSEFSDEVLQSVRKG